MMTETGERRIAAAFRQARRRRRACFIPYLTAGYPSLAATEALVVELAARGADLIELGLPFSDPLADGPTIQWASAEALRRGVTVQGILALARRLRRRTTVPLMAMTYANLVYRRGVAAFCRAAAAAGLDGLIVPDLPPEEAQEVIRAARPLGLATIFLAAPTSPPARLRRIAAVSRGFIYCVSLTGVTGARRHLPPDLMGYLRRVRRVTRLPLAVGFGVSRPTQVRQLARVADGVIVGSAILQAVARGPGRRDLAARIGAFVRPLMEATRR